MNKLKITLKALGAMAKNCFLHGEFLYKDEGVFVFEKNGVRCLSFGEGDGVFPLQGAQSASGSRHFVFAYTKFMAFALALRPCAGRVLVLGLGIGTLPRFFHDVLPEATVEVVELSSAVLKAAKKCFGFSEGPNLRVTMADAYEFVTSFSGEKYDIILMDIFDKKYIPPKFLTVEFLVKLRSIGDLVVVNTFSSSPNFEGETALFGEAFGKYLEICGSNRIVFAGEGLELPTPETIKLLAPKFAEYGISLKDIAAKATWQTVNKT